MRPATPKKGDLVRLLSGGPVMTVEWTYSSGSDPYARCTWFDDRNLPHSVNVQTEALAPAEIEEIRSG